jgi:uncharacterized membrane protein YfcA
LSELLFLGVYLAAGAVAGVIAGLLGVGGGVVIVPALVWVFTAAGVDASVLVHLAVGTSLATIIVTAISSIRAHQKRGAILWDVVRKLAPGIVVGAWLGAAIADLMPAALLQRVFATLIILVGIQMLGNWKAGAHRQLPGSVGMFLSGNVIGAVSAIVGIGGGIMTVPFLTWCSVEMRRAVATSAANGLPIAAAGALGFVVAGWNETRLPEWTLGYLHLPALVGVASASFLTAPIGARLAHTLPIPVLKRVFSVLLLFVGARMLLG